ncbi:hypothetical protein [Methylobacterium gnaphalii]|uniref:hypothetical protein n=1 Tax=Methylobacterium gnaphalii TaxID=1010610 RepID=UPI00147942BD|nr:hypothetical protein [Methylobacterium gnaphalii]
MTEGDTNNRSNVLEDNIHFKNLAAYTKLRKDISEVFHAKTADAQKLSTEFSKLIITNLQFINAGGLLAVPSLSTSFLGLSQLQHCEKMLYLGLPMAIFTIGLLSASLSALFTYFNYQAVAQNNMYIAAEALHVVDEALPNMPPEIRASNELTKREVSSKQAISQRSIRRNYYCAFIAGWTSIGSFIASCILLAAFSR